MAAGGFDNKPAHHKLCLQLDVKKHDWHTMPVVLQRPQGFVYQQSQSTEQQEAFSSIVCTRLDYSHFK